MPLVGVGAALAEDTGISPLDHLTSSDILTGTAASGSSITVRNGTTVLGTATASQGPLNSLIPAFFFQTGTWSFTPTGLADGSYTLTATYSEDGFPIAATEPPFFSSSLSFILDTTAPAVGTVTASPAAADLGTGQVVTLTMSLSEAVTVNTAGGAPTLLLNDGGTASYTGGSGTSTLTFAHTATAGQNTTDLTVTGAALNGATILDGAGNAANLALPATNFTFSDTTANTITVAAADSYSGPVAGIQHQFISVTTDNLSITASVPNSFIHPGSGIDAIDVSRVGGTNVLDGSVGSDFLVGGSGSDTFFVDDRAATADIWSTVVNFHAGDAATVWGVTQQGFNLDWIDNQGAAGFTGLTLGVTATGIPNASLTLAGFTSADLQNGRLTVAFGTDTASGSNYMLVQGH